MYFSATIAGVVPFLSTVHQLHASPENRSDVRNKRRRACTGARFRQLRGRQNTVTAGSFQFFRPSVSLLLELRVIQQRYSYSRHASGQPHRTIAISWYIRLIPLFHRLFVLWKNLCGKSSNDFDLLLRTIQRSLDNFPILRLTNFSVESIVLLY